MQIQITSYHYTPTRVAKIKMTAHAKVTAKLAAAEAAGQSGHEYSLLERGYTILPKLNIHKLF